MQGYIAQSNKEKLKTEKEAKIKEQKARKTRSSNKRTKKRK